MTFTPNEIAAAAAVQACIDRVTSLPERLPFLDPESGYPGPGYAEAVAPYRAVEATTLAALGLTYEEAGDVRWRIAFQFEGERPERVAVMGEHWVANQEERGIVPAR